MRCKNGALTLMTTLPLFWTIFAVDWSESVLLLNSVMMLA